MDSFVYKCRICGSWYRRPMRWFSCLVLHSPGTCCHVGEEQLSAEGREWTPELAWALMRGDG